MSEESTSEPVSRRSWVSLLAVLFVQTQNSFNDNFVKMVLIGLGLAVAQGTIVFSFDLGEKIQYILTMLIPIPFILGAPVAGWISDRFSKKHVIIASLILQLAIFILIALAIIQKQVMLAIFGYFLLAVQSTLFSPAKQGILKELVGSAKLGLANGLMQMLSMIGILGGIGLGGWWFDKLLANLNEANGVDIANAWSAAMTPTIWIGCGCLAPLLISMLIQKTPAHRGKRFEAGIWFRHFEHLGLLFKRKGLRPVAIRIALYWLIANFIALVFVTVGKELFPDAKEGGAASATSGMMLCVGAGLFLGSIVVSVLSRKKIQLRLIPLGAIGMVLGITGVLLFDPSNALFKPSIGGIGFFSSFLIIPLSAQLQDLAPEDERGRIISASNLLNSVSGVIAIFVCNGLDSAGFDSTKQILVVLVVAVGVVLWTIGYWRSGASTVS